MSSVTYEFKLSNKEELNHLLEEFFKFLQEFRVLKNNINIIENLNIISLSFNYKGKSEYNKLMDKLTYYISNFILKYEESYFLELVKREFVDIENIDTLFEKFDLNDYLPYKERIFLVNRLVRIYLEYQPFMNIKGFSLFRMTEYKNFLIQSFKMYIEIYKIDPQKEEFISLIKYFLATVPINNEVIHIINKDNNIVVLNKDKELLLSENLIFQEKEKIEDSIISKLIDIYPFKIIIHSSNKNSILELIFRIFDQNVEFCYSCNDCML